MSQLKLPLDIPEGYQIVFVASITLKNGKKIYVNFKVNNCYNLFHVVTISHIWGE